jgi:3-oxoacyl-[acyl-carrier-protein] synthase III
MNPYLSALAHTAGDEVSIFDLPELAEGDLLARLHAGGLSKVKVFSAPDWAMAAGSARATLDRTREDLVPDTVVYGSDAATAGPSMRRFLHESGLDTAVGFGTNLNRCANFGAMLTVSGALVGSGCSTACLLVSVDSVAPARQRLLSDEIGVLSDVAATAVVSAVPAVLPAYRILAVESAASAGLDGEYAGDTQAAADFFDGIEGALDRLARKAGTRPSEFTRVVTNNYTYSAVAALHEIADIGMERAYRGTAAEYSHCHSADGLISLERLSGDGLVGDGDTVLVLSTSTSTWFLAALEHVTGERTEPR